MQWFFTYGSWTDPDQMKKNMKEWERYEKAALKDHIYTFTGEHPVFKGGSSTAIPLRGGTVLGVAYLIDEQWLQELGESGDGYVVKENRASIGSVDVPVLMLQPQKIGPVQSPSSEYLTRVQYGLSQHYPKEVVEMYLARARKRASGQELVTYKTPTPETFKREYGCDFRRLFPWEVTRQSSFGSAWAIVRPGEESKPHCHDEEETFIFLNGEGLMSVDGHKFPVRKGDAVYLEPFSAHTVRNTGEGPLEMLCVWWGAVTPA